MQLPGPSGEGSLAPAALTKNFFTCYMSIGLGGGDLVSGMYLALDCLVKDICELVC